MPETRLQVKSRIDGEIGTLLEQYGGGSNRDIEEMFHKERTSDIFDISGDYGRNLRFLEPELLAKFAVLPPRYQKVLISAVVKAMQTENQDLMVLKVTWRSADVPYTDRWLVIRKGFGIWNDNPEGLTFSIRADAPL